MTAFWALIRKQVVDAYAPGPDVWWPTGRGTVGGTIARVVESDRTLTDLYCRDPGQEQLVLVEVFGQILELELPQVALGDVLQDPGVDRVRQTQHPRPTPSTIRPP